MLGLFFVVDLFTFGASVSARQPVQVCLYVFFCCVQTMELYGTEKQAISGFGYTQNTRWTHLLFLCVHQTYCVHYNMVF